MKPSLIVDAPIMGQKKVFLKQVSKPHFDHPFHFHHLCEITWIEKGHGKLVVGDFVGNFFEDELVLSGPELPHLWKCDDIYYNTEKNLLTKAVGLYFPPELIENMTDDAISINLYNDLMCKAERGLRFFGKTKTKIIEKIKEISISSQLAQLGVFLQIIDILSTSNEYEPLASAGYKKSANDHDIKRFNDVYHFLLENFSRDIMLKEVANTCNMTPNAFCRFFKQKTQKTFTGFLNEIRIGHARQLLQDDNVPIKGIGYECGFNNSSSFFSCFKQATGQTPKQFRGVLQNIG